MGESVGRPVMLAGVTTKRWPGRTRGAELALGVVAWGLVPFVAHRAEVRVVNVAVDEIAQTRSMDGHGEKLQRVAPPIPADLGAAIRSCPSVVPDRVCIRSAVTLAPRSRHKRGRRTGPRTTRHKLGRTRRRLRRSRATASSTSDGQTRPETAGTAHTCRSASIGRATW